MFTETEFFKSTKEKALSAVINKKKLLRDNLILIEC
jgi:hypothetical protein